MTAANPVWPNSPSPGAFLPLVVLLLLVVPWMHIRFHAWYSADQAEWGLRSLDALSGDWRRPGDDDRPAPPLFAWLHAVWQAMPISDRILSLTLPGCFLGIGSCLLTLRLGRLWYSQGAGVMAAFLATFQAPYLLELERGDDGVATLFFTLLSLVAFAEHLRRQDAAASRWTVVGALAFAGVVLSAGAYAVWLAIFGVVAMYLRSVDRRTVLWRGVERMAAEPTVQAGALMAAVGLAAAAIWLPWRSVALGPYFPWTDPHLEPRTDLGWQTLFASSPAIAVLGFVGWIRGVRECLKGEEHLEKEIAPVLWTFFAAAAFTFTQRTSGALLVINASLDLLAVRTVLDLLNRRVRDLTVLWLALAVSWSWIFTQSTAMRKLPQKVGSWESSDWLAFHLAMDAAIAAAALLIWLYRRTAEADERRRTLFGGVAVGMLVLACAPGLAQLRGRPRSENPWLRTTQQLDTLLQRQRFDLVVYLHGPAEDGGEFDRASAAPLRFFLKATQPHLPQLQAGGVRELERLVAAESDSPLVVVTDSKLRLSRATPLSGRTEHLVLTEQFDSTVAAGYAASRERKTAER